MLSCSTGLRQDAGNFQGHYKESPMRTAYLTLPVLLLLAACSSPQPDSAAQLPATPSTAQETAVCNADKVQWAVGQLADATLLERAKKESASKTARILTPGSVVTLEYNHQRLNLKVDKDNKVEAAYCG